jgi:NADP-dependent 3-hydroxy acid dehydrogenase YdfG
MSSSRTIVVSGAGTGIGRALASRLAAGGSRVMAVGRRREPLERLARESGGQIVVVAADVATEAGRRKLPVSLPRRGWPAAAWSARPAG